MTKRPVTYGAYSKPTKLNYPKETADNGGETKDISGKVDRASDVNGGHSGKLPNG